MPTKKITFINREGQVLSGRLELPLKTTPSQFAIFAHCFTCNKNLNAVKNISRSLAQKGFGVLRFDFTGLGESEGEFEDTNFSGNVNDLVDAAAYLENEFKAPQLLIGHSLGGAAVLSASKMISSVQAIVTIGAPSRPEHVQHLFKDSQAEINNEGKASVNIGGRPFYIKKQFIDDLNSQQLSDVNKGGKQAILIMHSPQDNIVGIENAEHIYKLAQHPKSFVSLDGADHLLSDKQDALYVGDVIAGWVGRYICTEDKENIERSTHQVEARLTHTDGFTTALKVGDYLLTGDEPLSLGGANLGPSPYEFVGAGLSACTVMTLQMYAKRKGWKIDVEIHTNHSKQKTETGEVVDVFEKQLLVKGDLDEKQVQRLMQIADKCPVHKTLKLGAQFKTSIIKQ